MTTQETLITEHLDIWSSAVTIKSASGRGKNNKLELYGVKKLRELILDLAVRGLLVPQDPNDEPASALLKKIAAEKARLIKAGKIKKQKKLPPTKEDEKPYKLSEGWEWCRLGKLGVMAQGGTPGKSVGEYWGGTIPFITGADIKEKCVSKARSFVTEKGFNSSKTQKCQEGDLLIVSRTGVGRFGIAATDLCISQDITVLNPFSETNVEYLIIFLKAAAKKIKNASQGLTIQGITRGFIENLSTPLPPLNEQHRIVAKVDELMSLCDRLEEQQETNITTHQTLVHTLLSALTDAGEQGRFDEAWARIAQHFDILFTTQESIDHLKQSILQLAVMGKLVPQNPEDEPASALLKKIAAEKARLIKAGKIKKQKKLPPIAEDETPFELPEGWVWVRLQDITSKITDGDHKTPPRTSEGFRLLSAKNVRDGFLELKNCDFTSEESYLKSRERCLPEEGDLLIVSVGGTIGRSSVVPSNSNFALVRSVALIKPLFINSSFLKYSMDSNLMQNSIHERKRGGAQPCLYLSEIKKFPFSLPPIAEQHRIIAKIDELMALCDRLQERVRDSRTTQQHLADAMAQQIMQNPRVH